MEFFMMKKTAIALGIASMAFGAQAIEVFKNADTAIEVNVDMQFYNLNITESATASADNYFQGIGTQLQLKTSKMIDADLTVFGQFETDPDPVGDNATLLTDDMKFGIKSKSMGTIQFGQFDSYMEDNLMEIATSFFIQGYGGISEPTAMMDHRHVMYSHNIGDFAIGLDYTQTPNAASAATDSQPGFAYTASYKLGDLRVVAGASTISRYTSSYGTNANKEAKGIGASYSLTTGAGLTKFALLSATNTSYSTTTAYDGLDTKYNMFSVNHTYGQWNVGVISSVKDTPALSASTSATSYNEVGYQVVYDLGKGAKFYAASFNMGLPTSVGNNFEIGFVTSF
jgi:predicted porin